LNIFLFASHRTTIAMRPQPNIIVTGTPGVGKTTHCETLAENTGLKHLSINNVVKERGCHDGYDDDFKSWIVDEDKVSISPLYPPQILIISATRCDRRRDQARRLHY
jgi:tRNA uridine 5-carbamoylmethylation protein Kti12